VIVRPTSLVFLSLALLAACASNREISIPQSRLESDPDRYRDWIVRVHLRGDVEFVERDSVLVLRRATHDDPVVSCAMELGMAGGMPSSVSFGGLGGGMPAKWVPIHNVNQVLMLEDFEFDADRLAATVELPPADGHRYFVRTPELDSLVTQACTCIHPGYQQLNGPARIVVPEELIYRFSGLNPRSQPPGAGAVSERRTGGLLDSGLGLPPTYRDPLRAAPYRALEWAAAGQDSLALETIHNAIFEATRNELWPHDELYDHYVALLLIHTARGEVVEATNAAGHLIHFGELELPPLQTAVDGVDPESGLAAFLAARQDDVAQHWRMLREALE
jgi:hypothetical protein